MRPVVLRLRKQGTMRIAKYNVLYVSFYIRRVQTKGPILMEVESSVVLVN